MEVTKIIAIDPGANGGIAIYEPGRPVKVVKMPSLIELGKLVAEERRGHENGLLVFIERLSVRPDDVSVENGKINMGKILNIQKMMANFEQLKAVFTLAGVPFILVSPMTWQSRLKLRKKGEKVEKKERKNQYKNKAQEWYPYINVTLWNADALLILHFARFALKNDVKYINKKLSENEILTKKN